MPLASSTCVLFISLMKLVNQAQFLSIIFLLALFAAAPTAAVFGIVIFSLTCRYASL